MGTVEQDAWRAFERYRGLGVEYDDLLQEARLAEIRGAEKGLDGWKLRKRVRWALIDYVRSQRHLWRRGRGEPVRTVPIDEEQIAAVEPGREGVLSAREREIMALLAIGRTNRAIAAGLGIEVQSVKNCLSGCYRKMRVSSRLEAALAYRRDIGVF